MVIIATVVITANLFITATITITTDIENTSLAAKGALAHRLQRLQNPIWPPEGPKMADRVWKGVYPYVFGPSCHKMEGGTTENIDVFRSH